MARYRPREEREEEDDEEEGEDDEEEREDEDEVNGFEPTNTEREKKLFQERKRERMKNSLFLCAAFQFSIQEERTKKREKRQEMRK